MMDLKVGDMVGLNSLQTVVRDPEITMTLGYKPGRGQRFVCLFLGTEPKDSSNLLDGAAVLRALGWRLDLNGQEEEAMRFILGLVDVVLDAGIPKGADHETMVVEAVTLLRKTFQIPKES